MEEKEFSRQEQNLANLLNEWQATGDGEVFATLWSAASSVIGVAARQRLFRSNIRDPAAIEDAVALVLDHLRRLPEGGIKKYDQKRSAFAYLRWLAERRSQDIVRLQKRRLRYEKPAADLAAFEVGQKLDVEDEEAKTHERLLFALKDAMDALDKRSRQVIERHLAGDRQACIARDLGVSEGTVTRIRQRAIERLRLKLLEGPKKDRRPKPR